MRLLTYFTLALVAVSLSVGSAYGQPNQVRRIYDFEDETIDGKIVRPTYKRMIPIPKRLQNRPAKLTVRIKQQRAKTSEPNLSPNTRATRLFELAIAYAQEQQNWRSKAYALDDKIDSSSGETKASYIAQQKRAYRIEKNCLQNVIATYKALLCRANTDGCATSALSSSLDNADEALYLAVYTLRTAQRLAEAAILSERLIRNHPSSTYAPASLLFLAEQAFHEGDLPKAHALYEKVQTRGNLNARAFALYQNAWIQHNLNKSVLALEQFFLVIEMTHGHSGLRSLNHMAKRDFVKMYAFVGRPSNAYTAFRHVDKRYAMTMMQLLGPLLLEQGKNTKAISVYRSLLHHHPTDVSRCQWQAQIAEAAISTGNRGVIVRVLHQLMAEVRTMRANPHASVKSIAECEDRSRSLLYNQATHWHRESKETLNPQLRNATTLLYNVFLDSFSTGKEVAKTEFYYAEVLWEAAAKTSDHRGAIPLWQTTAEAYSRVVKRGKLVRIQQREAAHAAVLAWKNALAIPRHRIVLPSPPGTAVYPRIIKWQQWEMIKAIDRYHAFIFNDPSQAYEMVTLMYLKAQIYVQYDHLDEAILIFQTIVTTHASHETAPYAAHRLLDMFHRAGKIADREAWAERLLSNRELLSGQEELKKRLLKLKGQNP